MKHSNSQLNKKQSWLVVILGLLILVIGALLGWQLSFSGLRLPFQAQSGRALSDIREVYNLIRHEYFEEISLDEVSEGAIRGMLRALEDKNSFYFTAEALRAFELDEIGMRQGIGIIYQVEGELPLIIEVLPNSPASRVGLKRGEKITKINGKDLVRLSEAELRQKLSFPVDEPVGLEIINERVIRELNITPEKYKSPSFVLKELPEGVDYLKVYQFSLDIESEFALIADELRLRSVDQLIIDLRNNPGGKSTSVAWLADQFLDQGVIFTEEYRDGRKQVYQANSETPYGDLDLVVLVNRYTVSAAEVLAAALQESGRARIIGEITQGKGVIGDFFELSDGSAVHLTTGKWFTPTGKSIIGQGVVPDTMVVDDFNSESDEVLTTALEEFGF